MSATTRTHETRTWLLKLLGPEQLAALDGPISDAQATRIDAFLDTVAPAHVLTMTAINHDGVTVDPTALARLRAEFGGDR